MVLDIQSAHFWQPKRLPEVQRQHSPLVVSSNRTLGAQTPLDSGLS